MSKMNVGKMSWWRMLERKRKKESTKGVIYGYRRMVLRRPIPSAAAGLTLQQSLLVRSIRKVIGPKDHGMSFCGQLMSLQ